MESWINTLKKAIELDVEIDAYSLHVDPGTMLEKMIKTGKSPPTGNGEYEKQMYLKAYNMLTRSRLQSSRSRPLQPQLNGTCVKIASTVGHGGAYSPLVQAALWVICSGSATATSKTSMNT